MDKAKLAHEEEGWIALLPFFSKWALLSENNPKFMDDPQFTAGLIN